MDVIAVFLASLGASITFATTTALLGALFGLASATVGIGLGPRVASIAMGRIRLEVRPLPIGSFVTFRDPVGDDEDEDINPVFRLSVAKASLLLLVPPLLLIAAGITAMLASPSRAVRIGSLVAVWTGVSCLLPIPSQNGFALVQRLTLPASPPPRVRQTLTEFQTTSLLVLLVVGLSVFAILCFKADMALRLVETVLPTTPPH